ncbi:MAG TPA: phosphoribosyltransferase [Candidatus Enterocola sp.]|nr:phosphoribosyltransferase [Candidatus Enterocola sp.]
MKAVGKELAKSAGVPIYQLDKDQKIGVVLDRFLQRNPGINILLIDDVIYTGKTANLALKNLSRYKQVGKISFYPFAKSQSYK